jgi:hypothetical protein
MEHLAKLGDPLIESLGLVICDIQVNPLLPNQQIFVALDLIAHAAFSYWTLTTVH